jgi:hypothetical protein
MANAMRWVGVICLTATVACAEPAPRYGQLMVEVGRRFEWLGRAGVAGRAELARYELDELTELLDEELPRAVAPRVGGGAKLDAMRLALRERHVPDLARALTPVNASDFRASFARMAAACNQCHQASGHVFIEIPTEPGSAVPRMDPR